MNTDELTLERIGNTWVFSDGTVLPVVSGGDETAGAPSGGAGGGAPAADNGGGAPSGAPVGEGGGQGSAAADYSLGPGFLQRVPEEHRPIIEPYVKQWDAGVTRRFSELHSQLSPYQELGADPDTLRGAMDLMSRIESNPWEVYGILHQALMSGEYGPNPQETPGQQFQQTPQSQEQGLSATDIPAPVAQRLDQLQTALVAIGQHLLGQNQQTQQAQEDQQLNSWLQNLHTEFGDFDDQWLLTRMYANPNTPVDQHLQAWNQMLESRTQEQLKKLGKVPPILGGGSGGIIGDGQDVRGLSRKDTQALVAQMVAAASQNGK